MMKLKSLFKIPDKKIEKIYFVFSWIIRIMLIGSLILESIYGRGELVFVSGLALFLTLLPAIIESRYQIKMPPEFHIFIVGFIYAGIYLGEVQNFYNRFYWWDNLLHLLSGFVLGMIGFSIIFILDKGTKIKANPSMVAFLGFCFATTLGVFWEVIEFLIDSFFGMNMQKVHIGTGVTDTMIDFLVNATGAIIASVIGFFYLKYGKSKVYHKILNHFIKENSHIV